MSYNLKLLEPHKAAGNFVGIGMGAFCTVIDQKTATKWLSKAKAERVAAGLKKANNWNCEIIPAL